jgi:hypothetical protein
MGQKPLPERPCPIGNRPLPQGLASGQWSRGAPSADIDVTSDRRRLDNGEQCWMHDHTGSRSWV